jgi:hypothetical protein
VAAFAAQHLLPREGRDIDLVPRHVVGEHRAGRVGEAQALAVVGIQSPLGTRTPEVVPFQVNSTSFDQSTCVQIGQLAVIGADHGRIELELLDRIGHPAFAEALPGERRDGRAPSIVHIAISNAPVSEPGDDADAVGVGQLPASRASGRWHIAGGSCRS